MKNLNMKPKKGAKQWTKDTMNLEDDLTLSTQLRLLYAINQICELQYRKGYQQGATHGHKLTEREVAEWRFGDLSKAIDPISKREWAVPERWVMELKEHDMDFLHNLIGIVTHKLPGDE